MGNGPIGCASVDTDFLGLDVAVAPIPFGWNSLPDNNARAPPAVVCPDGGVGKDTRRSWKRPKGNC